MNYDKQHCRLCSECNEIDHLIDLSVDKKKYKQVKYFLTSLQTKINFSPAIGLPTVICFVCFNFLILIQQFLDNVKKTQDFLTSKLNIYNNPTSLEISDDSSDSSSSDSSVFDDTRGCEKLSETLEKVSDNIEKVSEHPEKFSSREEKVSSIIITVDTDTDYKKRGYDIQSGAAVDNISEIQDTIDDVNIFDEPLVFDPENEESSDDINIFDESLQAKPEIEDECDIEDISEELLASNTEEAESEKVPRTNHNLPIRMYERKPKSLVSISKSDVPKSIREKALKVEQLRAKNLDNNLETQKGSDALQSKDVTNCKAIDTQTETTKMIQNTSNEVDNSKSRTVSVTKHYNHGLFADFGAQEPTTKTIEPKSRSPKAIKKAAKINKSNKNTSKCKPGKTQRKSTRNSLKGEIVLESNETNEKEEEELELTDILQASTADARPIKQGAELRFDIESPKPFVWTCMICSKTFETMQLLTSHRKDDHGVKIKRKKNEPLKADDVTCKECNIVFTTQQRFYTHNRRHHDKASNRICEKCGKLFPVEDDLNNHIQSHHGGEKTHVCQICHKSFVSKTRLRAHLRIHTDKKELECNECGRKFRQKSQVISHLRVHSDNRPFACKFCKKTFRNRTNLKTHERIHTGDFIHECKPCGRKFSCWTNCNKHMMRIHKTTLKKATESRKGGDKNPKVDLEEWKKAVMKKNKPGFKPKGKRS